MSYFTRDWKKIRAEPVKESDKITTVRNDVELLRASLERELRDIDRSITIGITSDELGNMSSKEIETKSNNIQKLLSNGSK